MGSDKNSSSLHSPCTAVFGNKSNPKRSGGHQGRKKPKQEAYQWYEATHYAQS